MLKYVLTYIIFVLCLGMAVPALSEELSAEQEKRLEAGIREEVQNEIAPWRANHSKSGMNLDVRFGTPEWGFSFAPGTCSVTLAFPKGPMEWQEASRFQMNAVKKILGVFTAEGVPLDTLTFTLFSNRGKTLEGIASYAASDDMIRWKPK